MGWKRMAFGSEKSEQLMTGGKCRNAENKTKNMCIYVKCLISESPVMNDIHWKRNAKKKKTVYDCERYNSKNWLAQRLSKMKLKKEVKRWRDKKQIEKQWKRASERERERAKRRKVSSFVYGQHNAFKLRFVCVLRKLYRFEPILIARKCAANIQADGGRFPSHSLFSNSNSNSKSNNISSRCGGRKTYKQNQRNKIFTPWRLAFIGIFIGEECLIFLFVFALALLDNSSRIRIPQIFEVIYTTARFIRSRFSSIEHELWLLFSPLSLSLSLPLCRM